MRRPSLPALALALAAALPMAASPAPVAAQQSSTTQQGNPEATRRGLTGADIQKSQDPQPTQQGDRSPKADTEAFNDTGPLYAALAAVRRAPPGLDGKPVPRPNPLASEPDDPVEASRSPDPSFLTRGEVDLHMPPAAGR